ncbi:GPO family capsid scaffolding protein [Pseudomonas batumici]|uniref:GPO family capsid scaffolding protein n=1 Tax=Pseudomonas batumici TaxID=226910 RepID=UPI0030CD65D3
MTRALVTDWKCIATSGKTADGRTLDAQDLRDMATCYNPNHYTAVIWYEHIRYLGNFGTVAALKCRDLGDGRVGLFAQLKPNDRLLQLNKEAQKLFTSIEIRPNFADSGKPYLAGLAITDQPASLGTDALHFSRRAGEGNHFGAPEPLGDLSTSDLDDTRVTAFFSRLFSQLHRKDAPESLHDETPSMEPKSVEAFTAAVEKLGNAAESLEKSAATFAAQPDKAAPTEPSTALQSEEYKSLKSTLDELTETFNKALNQGRGQDVPPTTGAVDDPQEEVY